MRRGVRACVPSLVVLALAGCGLAGPVDRSGSGILVLTLATVDGQVDSNGYQHGPAAFVAALPEVSDGRIQVEVLTTYAGGGAGSESALVEAIATGEVDGGWPASRAFARAGMTGVAALEAPMTVTSYAAARDVVDGEATELVAAALEGTGITYLGLAVGPLRRPFGVDRSLTSTSAWHGARIRSFGSPVQERSIRALGGQPVAAGVEWAELAEAGELDGVELDLAQYLANGHRSSAVSVVSNVVLWPETFVLSMSESRWSTMTDEQRTWVSNAAELAVRASIDGAYPDDEIATDLCARDVTFASAGPEDLAALRRRVQPVLDELAADAVEAPLLREVLDAARRHPVPDVVTVPPGCTTGGEEPGGVPTRLAPVPDGVYRAQLEVPEVLAAGLTNNDGTSGTWTLEVERGSWALSCRPLADPGTDCGHSTESGVLDAGTFRGDGRVLWRLSDPERLAAEVGCALPADGSAGHCPPPPPPARLRWALVGDELRFDAATTQGHEWVLEPFERID